MTLTITNLYTICLKIISRYKDENYMTHNLFVYGTLAPGRNNEHVLTNIGGTWEPGAVKGHLKDEGWGAKIGYPGIVLDEAGEDINGYIFSSNNLDKHWDELDEFEGVEYQRVIVEVQKKDSSLVKAFIYVLRKNHSV